MIRFNIEDSVLALIDYQIGTMVCASTTPLDLLRKNVLSLARFAKGVALPVVLTSSQETELNVNGSMMPELEQILPFEFASRIRRTGIVSAWDDRRFVAACRASGRHNLIVAGVTTDVGVVASAISAVVDGYKVKVVCDACGSTNQIAEQMAWRRLEAGGVELTSTSAIVAELVKDWTSRAGEVGLPLLLQ